MEPDLTAIGEKKKRRAPRAILWLLGIPGDLIIIIIGVYPFTVYVPQTDLMKRLLIGSAIAVCGLLALWLNILLIKLDLKRKQEVPRAIIVLFFLWMTVATGLATYNSLASTSRATFWEKLWPFTLAWAVTSFVLFLQGLSSFPQAVRGSKKLALILWPLLLVLLVSTEASFFIITQHQEHRIYRGSCLDNLRTLDSAIMQYAAANDGVYPQSTEDLVGTYIRAPLPREPYGGAYYLDPPGQTSTRAVCSKGHTY